LNTNCCLCGLPYERLGNNPHPLSQTGRCCDACDEVVIQARIDPKTFLAEVERVGDALVRIGPDNLQKVVLAAICASRGPGLRAEKREALAKLRRTVAGLPDEDPPIRTYIGVPK
jgi:hypothetical protein